MITLKSTKASVPIEVLCNDSLREQGQWLADTVADFEGRGRGLVDGATVNIGWTTFHLRTLADGSLRVCEPDYATDPFKAVRMDVSDSLTVLVGQIDMLRAVNLTAEPCRFDQTLIVRKGTLPQRHVFARRAKPAAGDSGWYLGPTESPFGKPAPEDLQAVPLYSLMNIRPQILLAMALPVGCMVVWNGTDVAALFDACGKDLR